MPELQLFWRSLDKAVRCVEVDALATVDELKAAIEAAGGPPRLLQHVLFQGAALHDRDTLADVGVCPESTVEVTRAARTMGQRVSVDDCSAAVVLADGSVGWWGPVGERVVSTSDIGGRAESVVVGKDALLVVRADGVVVGFGPLAPTDHPAGVKKVVERNRGFTYLLEDGSVQGKLVPQLHDGKKAIDFALWGHCVVLTEDGSVYATGLNALGQAAVPDHFPSKPIAVSVGSGHSAAILEDGSVMAWGDPSRYGGESHIKPPVRAYGLAMTVYNLYVLQADGEVLRLGKRRQELPEFRGPVLELACCQGHGVAVLRDGSLQAWNDRRALREPDFGVAPLL
eukprot:TRINITY_DN1501_c0_g1_i5.p1 TRINITY_DN1501_c0_g1~~TRINITY_DN1501_c0_g1_i5.p1  ORF type:complete len:341 (+),score=70.04 TRINITY_DN1501_c0_g1_i5:90-1112(+)